MSWAVFPAHLCQDITSEPHVTETSASQTLLERWFAVGTLINV